MRYFIFLIFVISVFFFLSCESDNLEHQALESEAKISNKDTMSDNSAKQKNAIACALTFTFNGSATDMSGNPWVFNGDKTFKFEWDFDPISCNFGTIHDVSLEFRTNPLYQCVGNSGSTTSFGTHSTGLSYIGNQVYYYNPIGDVITDKIFEYRTVITLEHCTGLNIICTLTSEWDGPLCSYMW